MRQIIVHPHAQIGDHRREPLLLRTPAPRSDESLMGFVLRVTEANHYDSAAWVLRLVGAEVHLANSSWRPLVDAYAGIRLRWDAIGLSQAEVSQLINPLGLGPDAHASASPTRWADLPDLVRFSRPKVCPACLREDPYYRRAWDLLFVTCCPVHRVVLYDRCLGCGRAVSWFRKEVARCRCGYDWRADTTALPADAHTAVLAARFMQLVTSGDVQPWPERSPFAKLAVIELSAVVLCFAASYAHGRHPRWLSTKTSNVLVHAAIKSAAIAMTDWPRRFYGLCERASRDRTLHRLTFRAEALASRDSTAFVQVALDEYVRRWAARHRMPPEFAQPRFTSREEACRLLGVGREQFEMLMGRRRVRLVEPDLVDMRSIVSLLEWRNQLLKAEVAASMLAIPDSAFHDLVRHGFVELASGPEIDGFSTPRVAHEVLAAACKAFLLKVTTRRTGCRHALDRHGLIGLSDLARRCTAERRSFGGFVAAVMRDEIKVVRIKRDRAIYTRFFDFFGVCRPVAEEFFQNHAAQGTAESCRAPTCESVRSLLGRAAAEFGRRLNRESSSQRLTMQRSKALRALMVAATRAFASAESRRP